MAPDRIHFLKFILEGYDNMAFQSTIDAKKGFVDIRYPIPLEKEVLTLVENLSPAIGVVHDLDYY